MLVLTDPVHVFAKLETHATMPIKATQEIFFNIISIPSSPVFLTQCHLNVHNESMERLAVAIPPGRFCACQSASNLYRGLSGI